jgi:predicted GNAT family acetyltransferase
MSQEVQHQDGQFSMLLDGHESVLQYRVEDGAKVDFYRTFVPGELRGHGVAAKLVDAGLAWAEQEQLTVIPSCSYVEKYLARKNRA